MTLIDAWVNDENTLRTYGSKTDAYRVFSKMLDGGTPPDGWKELLSQAKDENALKKFSDMVERSADGWSGRLAPNERLLFVGDDAL